MYKSLFIGGLILALIILGTLYYNMKVDRDRLKVNQAELLERTGMFREDSTKNAENVRQLTLTIQELKESRPAMVAEIKDQGIKPKDIQGVTTTISEATAEITAPVEEIPQPNDTLPKIIQRFAWTDGYFSFKGTIEDKILKGRGTYRDTLQQTLYRVRYKFLFFRWGTKEIRQMAQFSNPNAKIVYQEVLKIEK